LIWTALALAALAALQGIDGPLKTAAAPLGIVSFELARDWPAAQSILASWDEQAQLFAALSLGLDYLFMLAYSTALALGCVWAGERLRPRAGWLAAAGVWLAWGMSLAALLDATENLALIRILFGAAVGPWPGLAWGCASIKFLLVGGGLVFVAAGAVGGKGNA